jgi:hypothetical protein
MMRRICSIFDGNEKQVFLLIDNFTTENNIFQTVQETKGKDFIIILTMYS